MGFFDDVLGAVATPFTAPVQIAQNVLGGLTGQSAQAANDASQRSANNAFAMSQDSADKQMAFQERMSNTSYQRAMADMAKAGLNPMLAFSQGGASTPGGASASAQGVQYDDKGAAALKNISSFAGAAKDVSQLGPALAQMKASTRTAEASASQTEAMTAPMIKKVEAETNYTNSAADAQAAQADQARANTSNLHKTNEKIAEEIKNLIKTGKIQDLDAETKGRINQWQKQHPHFFRAKQVLDTINPLSKIMP